MVYKSKEFTVKENLKVVLRTPRLTEAKKLLNFIVKVCGQTDFLLSSQDDIKFTIKDEKKWLETIKEGPDYLIAVYVGDTIIGDASLNFKTNFKEKHRCEVGIVLDKKYWNKGIGSLVFDELVKLAMATKGVEQMELNVFAHNENAKRLYEKKGFVKVATIPNAIKSNDGLYHDEEIMIKQLY